MEAPWQREAGRSAGPTKYRQIAEEDHTDILGNNLEPVSFGSLGFFHNKKKEANVLQRLKTNMTYLSWPGLLQVQAEQLDLIFSPFQVGQHCLGRWTW